MQTEEEKIKIKEAVSSNNSFILEEHTFKDKSTKLSIQIKELSTFENQILNTILKLKFKGFIK